jgi:hypothetical protein
VAADYLRKETNSTPKARSNNSVLLIAAVVALCLAGICCLLIVAGILLFQIRTNQTVMPLPQILPQVQTGTVVPYLPGGPGVAETPAILDYNADPLFGSTSLQRAFTPDPYFVDVQAGGTVHVTSFNIDCGFTTSAPSFTFRYGGGASETFLRIFFTASDGTDTMLVVYTPKQEWQCADDSSYGGLVDPVVDLEFGPSGKYVIWVGTKLSDTYAAGKLYITGSESIAP